MGAPMKCLDCDARWYGTASSECHDCGSDNIDVDAAPSAPDERMLEMVSIVKERRGLMTDDAALDKFCDDRGNGFDTFNLCVDFGLVVVTHDDRLDVGHVR